MESGEEGEREGSESCESQPIQLVWDIFLTAQLYVMQFLQKVAIPDTNLHAVNT